VDRDAEWRAVDALKRAAEPGIRQAARAYFQREKERVLQRLSEVGTQRLQVSLSIEDLLDTIRAAQDLLQSVSEPVRQAMEDGFQAGLERLQADGSFNDRSPLARETLRALNTQLRKVPETTRTRINQLILDAEQQGQDLDTLSRRIRELYEGTDDTEGMTTARSDRIAQTSATATFESGQLQAWRQNGVTAKEWLVTRDGRQREGHNEADGQTVELAVDFEVRGVFSEPFEKLTHPGDPDGRASNVVNCRCSMLPRSDTEDN
jgi:uncharacterized protein with gpF-like domain